MAKFVNKSKMLSVLRKKGHVDIELTYHKSEGWWLSSNLFDNWLGGCSKAAFRIINNFEKDKNYLNE